MGTSQLQILQLLIVVTIMKICTAQDMTLSVYTSTSKSMSFEWTPFAGASSYKLTATPKDSPEVQMFAQFSQFTVMGSMISLSPDTQYTVQIEAMDDQMTVLASTEIDAATAPETPSIDQTYSKTSESITVEFAAVAGATGYKIRAKSKSGSFFLETRVSGSPGTIQGLQPYTEYEISLMSENAAGRSQPTPPVDQRTVLVAPDLDTSSPNSTKIMITWEAVDHAVEYVFVIIEEASMRRDDHNTTDTMLELDNRQPGSNYTIKVQAVDAEGRLGDAKTFSQITRPASPDVIYIQIDAIGRSTLSRVYWGGVPGAVNYTVITSNNQTCNSTNHSYCNLNPVICGQNLTLTVIAENGAGPSQPSDKAKYLTYPCPPNNTWIVEDNPGNCSVLWNPVDLVEHYMVYVKGNDDGKETSCDTKGTRCNFECKCGHTFVGIVIPHNEAGGSPVIQMVNYTTIPCCPDNVNVTLLSSETLEINWPDVHGANLYQVTANETKDILHCNDTESVCALSDLKCGTEYSIKVTPCSEISGCNTTCKAHKKKTAPCPPEVKISQENSSTYRVTFNNKQGTNYTVTAKGSGADKTYTCSTSGSSCDLQGLPCGTIFKVVGVAKSPVGKSLPSYEETLETGPCCPASFNVSQQTQAMTNVSWSPAVGARSFVTSLKSPRGEAKCHTVDNHCLMGCITCGTNYTVSMVAISSTGHNTTCSYKGFSSSPCCPTHIKIYRSLNNNNPTLRVTWRALNSPLHKHSVELTASSGTTLSCVAPPGQKFCEVVEPTCEITYSVLVAPLLHDGSKVTFCQKRVQSVPCPGSGIMIRASE